ncbi:DUF4032 domain-containing protein [Thermosporothrix hazakensis]|nr:DUF4032 domain-containing protein [Thermosporothrix hazakensis]
MAPSERHRLEKLPWHAPLSEWDSQGVDLLIIRRGESRHPVVFVECQGMRYAIKETTPHMAEREIRNLREIERRGIPALSPVGSVAVAAPPIPIEIPGIPGARDYIKGDRGYTVTRLAPRVIPHVLLYRLPLKKRSKQRILSAVAVLMVELHEHGIYWGDPSLANVLIRIDGRRILAILSDAETAELFPDSVNDELREQDLALFGESLAWQAEDLRQAKGLPEDKKVLDDRDYRYFERRYRWLRREHARITHSKGFDTLLQAQRFLRTLHRWGFSLAEATERVFKRFQVTTVLPGWYQRRLYELLHISMPPLYAPRLYQMILGHQIMSSQREKRPISIEEAARDWYERYHLPTILMLRRNLSSDQEPMDAYFDIMDHKWKLSQKAGYEVSIEDAILDWSMEAAETGELGKVDPAKIATWWRERQPVAKALEPPLIESEELEPLLSTGEKPLVRLNEEQLEQKLPEILEKGKKAR